MLISEVCAGTVRERAEMGMKIRITEEASGLGSDTRQFWHCSAGSSHLEKKHWQLTHRSTD
jgi:hypothetical protein